MLVGFLIVSFSRNHHHQTEVIQLFRLKYSCPEDGLRCRQVVKLSLINQLEIIAEIRGAEHYLSLTISSGIIVL